MEGVRIFLESSTIHGLAYISTTRKWVKIFWILVVVSGFAGAGYIIKESFDSWSESPVKTTIETLPMDELKFPKVTVCPPKNTFTDLNYDLMMTENITLTQEMRDDMFKYAVDVLKEDSGNNSSLLNLYKNALYGEKFRIAIIASNIIQKAESGFKVSAIKIFAKISSVLGFQQISYHYDTEGKPALRKNIFDIKGETLMHYASITPKF